MAGAGAGLEDLAIGEHAHGGAAAVELQRWPRYIGLKSGQYCQGHPGGADQCLNDKGNRKFATYGYDDKKKFFCKSCADEACKGYLPMCDVKSRKCVRCKKKQPTFGMPDDERATYCCACKLNGMVDIVNRMCVQCNKTHPVFGMSDDKRATHCGQCKKDGMVDITSHKCVQCKKTRPSFGIPDNESATHCGTCKLDGMVDVKNRMCVVCEKTQPNFGMPDDKRATHCGTCKLGGMVDIKNPTCVNCKKTQPAFGKPDDQRATYCGKCKLDDMVNINSRKCVVCEKTHPVFGMPDDERATHCGPCKLDGMVDIKNRKCVQCDTTQPVFGMPYDERATYCATCKLDGMVDIKNRMCVQCDTTQPVFGMPDDERATYCCACKLNGMVDIVNRMCVQCNKTVPVFGMSDDKRATHCGTCKLYGMVDIVNRMCVQCEVARPFFGMPDDKRATRCSQCKLEGMVDVMSKKCAVEGCPTHPSYPWAPYCAGCYADLYPDDPLVQAHNKTEAKIKAFLNDSLDAGISSLSTFNAMNVRGNRAPAWVRPYEFDFVILGERGIIHCDGGQHKRDVARFNTTAADQIENDVNKSALVLDRGFFEVRIDQDDAWRDRCDWRSLLTGMLAFGVTRKLAGEATCVVGRRDEADLSYGPYVDAMLQTPHADRIYEAFLTPNERDMLTVIHRASGARTHWRIPSDFTLARWPEGDAAPAAPAVPTQLTLEGAFKRRKLA
jgi:hypothetical protein